MHAPRRDGEAELCWTFADRMVHKAGRVVVLVLHFALLQWTSEYAVPAYTTADSAVLHSARTVLFSQLTGSVVRHKANDGV